jgi:hypothetical protein
LLKTPVIPARDQQKWEPVLRPIARHFQRAHDLIAKPPDTLADHALAVCRLVGMIMTDQI